MAFGKYTVNHRKLIVKPVYLIIFCFCNFIYLLFLGSFSMLHLVYILAFTVIAFFAISNLIRSLITISGESQRGSWTDTPRGSNSKTSYRATYQPTHPELFDSQGKPINEPLLVIRSVSVEDARQRLDSIYESSPSQTTSTEEEA
jgi:hypothetical protein